MELKLEVKHVHQEVSDCTWTKIALMDVSFFYHLKMELNIMNIFKMARIYFWAAHDADEKTPSMGDEM